ncbi:mechanosensitive ion channel family protein [Sphingomonas aracearum]|uniref:Mechanosensitive ion channel MscS domain-containing protein n=1 Tax=Sphingomonas aracearum TaxID=2283317 RepID=A0A369W0G0_9SPHN|nr:mechanosensitive ion channel domain-containing protein [Sphingomonas aracearum]RDE07375.1 hypothetical protein DVW87_07080 [Sphingomonas aracearum]
MIFRQLDQPFRADRGAVLLLAALGMAALVMWPLRQWLLFRLTRHLTAKDHATDLVRYGKALGTVIVTAACFVAGGLLVSAGLESSLQLLPEVRSLLPVVVAGFILTGVGLGVGRALRSPDAKHLRPMELPSGLGRTIGMYPFAAGLMLGLAAFFDQASPVLHASPRTWGLVQGILACAEALLIARFLIHAGRARERQVATAAEGQPSAVPAIFGATAVAWIALVVAIAALPLGHVRFAMTVLQEMMWALLVLSIAWLATRFLDSLVSSLLKAEHRAAKFATGVVGVGQSRVEQSALLVSAFFSVAIWLMALVLVLAPLHGDGGSVANQVRLRPMLASLGAVNLSPRAIFIAVAILVGGIVATRMVRGWMERRFLPSTSLDAGARNSIVTGFSYVGIIVALLATSATLGLQLDKITLIASALTVGIGFGLQAIIQNFVSGVILLFERPIKIGDWVSVGGAEGRVRKMRVRATEVVADDGSIAIIPNSQFISSTVMNKSDATDRSSFDLTIKIAGCDSAHSAKELLQNRIAGCDAVRRDPPPHFYLEQIGDAAWTFRVRMHASEQRSQASIVSDLLFHLSELTNDRLTVSVA